MTVYFSDSLLTLPTNPRLHRYEWSDSKGYSGFAAGSSVAKVRMKCAYSAYDANVYRTIGDALKAIKVRRLK